MFTKLTVALAIALGTISGAMAATKKPVNHTQQGNAFFYCSQDGRYCGGAEYWENFRYMGD